MALCPWRRRDRTLGVGHLQAAGLGLDHPGVAHLPAGLGIERGAVDEHLDLVTLLGPLHSLPLAEQGENPAGGRLVAVAEELGGTSVVEQPAVGVGHPGGNTALPGGTGALPLSLHLMVELCGIDPEPLLFSHFPGDFDGKPVCVVELEGGCAGDLSRPVWSRSSSASNSSLPDSRVRRNRASSRSTTSMMNGSL